MIWLIAGEPSGDLIGARLIVALRERLGGDVRLAGIGGEGMSEEGLESLFPISEIAVMGLIEIIPRIPLIKRRMRETISRIESDRPDIVVSIDVPGFCYDIWKGLRGSDIPLVHYVAPTVWAWRPDRAKKFAAELDYLMTLLLSSRRISKKKASIQRLSAILFWKETPETAPVLRSERPMISVRIRQLFPSCRGAGAVR